MKKDDFKEQFLASISNCQCFMGKANAEKFIQNLYDVLFQIGEQQIVSENDFNVCFETLQKDFDNVLQDVLSDEQEMSRIHQKFFDEVPTIYNILIEDAEFILQSDPAANSVREIQIAYPGFFATAVYRFSHLLYQERVPILPRVLSEYAHSKTGIDIHPGASIGKQFMIDHGTGVVIGETTIIGNQVKIYQGVTLGALSVSRAIKNTKRHPTIKDNVVIYSGATILGGDTFIGENCVVGGNVWLTSSIEAETKVFHKSQIIVKGEKIKKEPINFVI